jgi:hypothetical protein
MQYNYIKMIYGHDMKNYLTKMSRRYLLELGGIEIEVLKSDGPVAGFHR